MFTDALKIGATVATPLGVIGLVSTLLLFFYYRRQKSQERQLQALPPEQRAQAVDTLLSRYKLDITNLTREQKFELLCREMDKASGQTKLFVITSALVFIVCFIIAALAYANGKSLPPTPSPGPTPAPNRIFTNDPEVTGFLEEVWLGFLRESDGKREQISEATIKFELKDGNLTGKLLGTNPVTRERPFEATYKYGHLSCHYFAQSQHRIGAAVWLFKGKPQDGVLTGYWLATDPEQNKIVSGPFVLTRKADREAVLREHEAWLNQPLYSFIEKESKP